MNHSEISRNWTSSGSPHIFLFRVRKTDPAPRRSEKSMIQIRPRTPAGPENPQSKSGSASPPARKIHNPNPLVLLLLSSLHGKIGSAGNNKKIAGISLSWNLFLAMHQTLAWRTSSSARASCCSAAYVSTSFADCASLLFQRSNFEGSVLCCIKYYQPKFQLA